MMNELTSVNIAGWLACLVFVLLALNQGGTLLDRFRGKSPQPPNEQLAAVIELLKKQVDGMLTKNEFAHHEVADKIAFNNLDNQLSALRTERKVDVKEIHKRINRVSIGVARLCGAQGCAMPGEEDEI